MHITAMLTPQELKRLLSYDAASGSLTWKRRSPDMFAATASRSPLHMCANWNSRHAGKRAFTTNSGGYGIGNIGRRGYKAHRVAWAIHYGKWPENSIDHINGDPGDNRIVNLRDVPQAINMRNQRLRSDNSSGHRGIQWDERTQRWKAKVSLGSFASIEEAKAARVKVLELLGDGYDDRDTVITTLPKRGR